MTPQEFKAWFEGFTEAFDKVPTKAQWARVKERVAEIDGRPVTERVFVDRYWPNYHPYPWYYYHAPNWAIPISSGVKYSSNTATVTMGMASTDIPANSIGSVSASSNQLNLSKTWDSGAAMYSLGLADAASIG